MFFNDPFGKRALGPREWAIIITLSTAYAVLASAEISKLILEKFIDNLFGRLFKKKTTYYQKEIGCGVFKTFSVTKIIMDQNVYDVIQRKKSKIELREQKERYR